MGKHSEEMVDTYDILGHVVTRGVYSREDALKAGQLLLGAVIILFDEAGNMLIQKRTGTRSYSGKWDFTAGGGAQTGESSKDTVKREFKEETGLDYVIEVNEPIASCRNKDWLVTYYAQVVNRKEFESSGSPHSDEVSEFKWVSIPEFEAMCSMGEFRDDVKHSLRIALGDIYESLFRQQKADMLSSMKNLG